MSEGRNTNRRPLIFLAIALFITAAAGLAVVYSATQATRAPVVAAASVVEPDAVIVSDDDAEALSRKSKKRRRRTILVWMTAASCSSSRNLPMLRSKR